jgi:hypothetical protein
VSVRVTEFWSVASQPSDLIRRASIAAGDENRPWWLFWAQSEGGLRTRFSVAHCFKDFLCFFSAINVVMFIFFDVFALFYTEI